MWQKLRVLFQTGWTKAVAAVLICLFCTDRLSGQDIPKKDIPKVALYHVYELNFEGSFYKATDNPVREVEFFTEWKHEGDSLTYKVHGFYDGNGRGEPAGNVFKVRFCPTRTGTWTLSRVVSSDPQLNGQHEGQVIACEPSHQPGFWEPDRESGGRWYRRSNGTHPYIAGNTMYSFLSEHFKGAPTGSSIEEDVKNNARYFNKLRFGITGDIYPHPTEKPFLDENGDPVNDGDYSHRPNPGWFRERVDLAVKTSFEQDMITDLILAGPDSEDARSTLRAGNNSGDARPFLRYIAARYGSYPNVWICLANEYDVREPSYTEEEIREPGQAIREFLPYPTPVSVHAYPHDWDTGLNTDPSWNDHIILQNKLKELAASADFIEKNYLIGGGDMPVINDELAYEGEGDGWSEADVIEAFLGAFTGGGYASTGYKPENKEGHYFHGGFDAGQHRSADNILWMREIIDEHISFWKMQPARHDDKGRLGIFSAVHPDFRALAWPGHEYLLACDQAKEGLKATLPPGSWRIVRYDIITREEKLLEKNAKGTFEFDTPGSRAVLYHFKRSMP